MYVKYLSIFFGDYAYDFTIHVKQVYSCKTSRTTRVT